MFTLNQLMCSFGLKVSELVDVFTDQELAHSKPVPGQAYYNESQVTFGTPDTPRCPGCQPAASMAYPRIIDLLPDGWEQEVVGIWIGTDKLRELSNKLGKSLLNLSFLGQEGVCTASMLGKDPSTAELERTSLYCSLSKRVITALPNTNLPVLIEFATQHPVNHSEAYGDMSAALNFLRVVKCVQALGPIPIVVVVVPPIPVNMDPTQILSVTLQKEYYSTKVRNIRILGRALGVAVYPLWIISTKLGGQGIICHADNRDYCIFSKSGKFTMEGERRIEARLLKLIEVLKPVSPLKCNWTHVLKLARKSQ
jgi:hypothetical protein